MVNVLRNLPLNVIADIALRDPRSLPNILTVAGVKCNDLPRKDVVKALCSVKGPRYVLAKTLISGPDVLTDVLAACPDFKLQSMLFEAIRDSNAILVERLLATSLVDAGVDDSFALILARDPTIARLLLNTPTKPARANAVGSRALFHAAHRGRAAVVRELLNAPTHSAHADDHDSRALEIAAAHGHTDVVLELLNTPTRPARANARRSIALKAATEGGFEQIVALLLHAASNAAHACARGSVALRIAVQLQHEGIVRLLLDAPVPANVKAYDSLVIRIAGKLGHAGIIDLLQNAAAAPEAPAAPEDQC